MTLIQRDIFSTVPEMDLPKGENMSYSNNRIANQLLLLAVVFGFAVTAQAQVSETGSFDPSKFGDKEFVLYERQLNALLKTRRDEEKAFVGGIVLAVRTGKLPAKLVQTTYGWIRNKRPDTKYPCNLGFGIRCP